MEVKYYTNYRASCGVDTYAVIFGDLDEFLPEGQYDGRGFSRNWKDEGKFTSFTVFKEYLNASEPATPEQYKRIHEKLEYMYPGLQNTTEVLQ